MRTTWLRYVFCTLGMLAMLGAIASGSVAPANALTDDMDIVTMDMSAARSEGCPKQVEPCSGCAEKICPELASCSAKCPNTFPFPPTIANLNDATVQEDRSIILAPSPAGILIPPLIRPPIV